jgi:hypothetical protein
MSQKILQLVQRLATPAVAAALAKEEMCLALAAVAQLKPFPPASAEAAMSSSVALVEPLARRSLRLIPQCTSQELRMVARGAGALRWSSTTSSSFVVEALIQGMYRHIKNFSSNKTLAARAQTSSLPRRGGRVRLGDLLAVAGQAMEAGQFFNTTLYMLITQEIAPLACESANFSSALAEETVAVACAYLGMKEGTALLQQLYGTLTATPTTTAPTISSGVAVLAKCIAGRPLPLSPAWAASFARWTQQRDALLAFCTSPSSSSSSSPSDAVDSAVMHQQKARHDVLRVAQRLRSDTGSLTVSDAELVKVLEDVAALQLHDPVALLTLDEALLLRLTASENTTIYEGFVYAQGLRYPRTLAMLRERDEATASKQTAAPAAARGSTTAASSSAVAAEALQPISVVQRVYKNALAGTIISDKDLFMVGNDINTCGADDVAKAVFVFAHARDIPSNLIMILANVAPTLTVDGVVALLRAAQQDRAGALRTVVESCLGNIAALQRSVAEASVESLVELATVLSLPHTRWFAAVKEAPALEAQLVDLTLAQLHLRVEEMPWELLLCVVRGVGRVTGSQDLIRVACGRLFEHLKATTATAVSSRSGAMCLDAVDALQSGDVVDERLLDFLASTLAAYFAPLTVSTTAGAGDGSDAARHAALLRCASLELQYESPQLAEVVGWATQVVAGSTEWAALSAELLVSAALFSFDGCNVSSCYASRASLPHRVLQHLAQLHRLSEQLTPPLATAIVDVLYRLTAAADVDSSHAIAYCVEAVLPLAASLTPATTARLICVVHRAPSVSVAIPPDVYDVITANTQGLSAEIFTGLCRAATRPLFSETLANRLVEVLPAMADRLTPHQLSWSVFGLGEVHGAGQRLSHQVMTEALSDYVVDNVELFTSGRDVAALLHGFAKLQCTKRNLYSVFAKQVERRCVRYTLDFQSISFLLFAFGSAKYVDQKLVNFLCHVYIDHVEELAAPDLLLTLRGVSRMCLLNAPLYWRLGDAVAKRADEFPLQAQCDLINAFGAVEQRHPGMAAALVSRIAANVSALPSVSAAVDVLASLWMMDFKVPGDASALTIADYVVQHGGELSSQDIMKLCSVICDTQWSHMPLLNAIVARSLELKASEKLEAAVARTVLDTLSSRYVFHLEARTQLSQLARSVSKEVVQLSGEEQEQLNLLSSQ